MTRFGAYCEAIFSLRLPRDASSVQPPVGAAMTAIYIENVAGAPRFPKESHACAHQGDHAGRRRPGALAGLLSRPDGAANAPAGNRLEPCRGARGMTDFPLGIDANRLAEAVRAACLQAAVAAHEDAGIQGLCEAGRWEAALGALQSLDLRKLIHALERSDTPPA